MSSTLQNSKRSSGSSENAALLKQLSKGNPTSLKNLAPPQSPYIPFKPTPKQWAFLCLPHKEAFYGGAAGGGKSVALLMAALQYVEQPGYSALLLRRTYTDLSQKNALMDMAQEWLRGTDAQWNAQTKSWVFPGGSTLTFGYLENENDKYRYQSSEYQFIGFDELTQFSDSQYLYLFSRLRRTTGNLAPLRMRAASNPGNFGHAWVKQRFFVDRSADRVYIPATLDDNPYLDKMDYAANLAKLDPVTREQLLHGDWDISAQGNFFKREWFRVVEDYPKHLRKLRYWDVAGSTDGDWTAGCLIGEEQGIYYLVDMRRIRATAKGVEDLIRQTAMLDSCAVRMEEEPGSSGKAVIDHYQREVLKGYDFAGCRVTGPKEARAGPVSSSAEAGNLRLVKGSWVFDFLEEACLFPGGQHDDQIDALAGAFNALNDGGDTDRYATGYVGGRGESWE